MADDPGMMAVRDDGDGLRPVPPGRISGVSVTVERREGVMTAVLDDGKANALTFGTITELRAVVGASVDENSPLILAGRTGFFSAGFDLEVMRSGDPDLVSSLAEEGFLLFREMLSAPVPVLAACTGHALAAGALLLLAADLRIGRPGTYQLGLNETRIGIALPQPAVDMARFRLGTHRLAAATLFATLVAPDRACDFGYLDRIDESPLTAARDAAVAIASVGLRAFAGTKRRMNAEIVDQLGVVPGGRPPA
jgi:enoyl-CoA hydratase